MKKIWISIVLVLVVVASVFSFLLVKNKIDSADSIRFSIRIGQKYDSNTKISFELDSKSEKLLGQTLPKYKIIVPRKENKDYYDDSVLKTVSDFLKSKGLPHNPTSTKFPSKNDEDPTKDTVYYYDDFDGILVIYENGSFSFNIRWFEEKKLTLTDEETIKVAEDFIKTYALDSGGFVVGEKRIITNKNTDNDITSKEVVFYRNINNFNVHEKSEISVVVTENGVVAFNSKYSEYEDYKNVKCLSYEDIKNINVFEFKKGQLTYDTSKLFYQAKSVVFNEVEIEYYDAPINQPELKYIKPIYKFTGLISDHLGNQTECVWLVEAEK